jgi:predicted transposase YbfD/YdcC
MIVESGNHYVIQVKKNAHKLYETIQNCDAKQLPIDTFEIKEKTHGRKTTWRIKVFEVSDPSLEKQWVNLRRFLVINKTIITTDKMKKPVITHSISYRISDVKTFSAETFLWGIRRHWGIENRTHWVKDVVLNEDNNLIKNTNGAVNMAVFNTIAINFLRQKVNDSVKHAQILFGQNVKELFNKFRT